MLTPIQGAESCKTGMLHRSEPQSRRYLRGCYLSLVGGALVDFGQYLHFQENKKVYLECYLDFAFLKDFWRVSL